MNNNDETQSTLDLYMKATENDWRAVKTDKPQADNSALQENTEIKEAEQAEKQELVDVARSILMNENGTIG